MPEDEREAEQSRLSMMSVPARWRELYFSVFSILCVLGEIFLVWYEIYQRDAESDYLDIIMNILLDTGPVAMAAAIAAFSMMKGRDTMLSTWETFSPGSAMSEVERMSVRRRRSVSLRSRMNSRRSRSALLNLKSETLNLKNPYQSKGRGHYIVQYVGDIRQKARRARYRNRRETSGRKMARGAGSIEEAQCRA